MQYNYWGCRKQKLWFWCLTVSQLVPTSIENVPVWFIMSQNVILVLRIQYYFWGCSKISEDAEGKNFYFDVSQGPNMSQRGSKGSRMLLMHSNYWKCMRMHEDAWGCTRMHEDVQGCSLVGAALSQWLGVRTNLNFHIRPRKRVKLYFSDWSLLGSWVKSCIDFIYVEFETLLNWGSLA